MTYNRSEPASDQTLKDLSDVRHSFLALHTLLLGIERAAYEKTFGKPSSGEMLKLVIGDEQFAWLHVISELVVRIDEMLDSDEPVTLSAAASVIDYSINVLKPSEVHPNFQQKYLAALQNEPDVIFAHREAHQILSRARENIINPTLPGHAGR
jgi:hypothetical protein